MRWQYRRSCKILGKKSVKEGTKAKGEIDSWKGGVYKVIQRY